LPLKIARTLPTRLLAGRLNWNKILLPVKGSASLIFDDTSFKEILLF